MVVSMKFAKADLGLNIHSPLSGTDDVSTSAFCCFICSSSMNGPANDSDWEVLEAKLPVVAAAVLPREGLPSLVPRLRLEAGLPPPRLDIDGISNGALPSNTRANFPDPSAGASSNL